METPVIFPQPRELRRLAGWLRLPAGKAITLGITTSGRSPVWETAVGVLKSAIAGVGGKVCVVGAGVPAQVSLTIADATGSGEGYKLEIDACGARLSAESPFGALHAAHTFRQLVRREAGAIMLPLLEIADCPVIRYRGIKIESSAPAAAMTMRDWRDLIDLMAELKLNTLLVALYSSWEREGELKEFLFLPVPKYPKLRGLIKEEYYSVLRGKTIKRRYLPEMFQHDLLGEIIAYAAVRGIKVVPWFNSLGHNTLIPRIYPEVSMKNAEGKPKGYGFCTSNPKTYEMLFSIYDVILKKHMRPHGLDIFGIGMDEVSMCCECAKCRKARNDGQDNFILRHIIRLGKYLKQAGCRRVLLTHDMLERYGLLNQGLADRLKKEKLDDVMTLCWWSHADHRALPELSYRRIGIFENLKTELGLHNWTDPSAGSHFRMPWVYHRASCVKSCMTHAQLVVQEQAEGMYSYSSHNPVFLEGYHAMAEYAWNPTATNDLRVFQERHYRALFGDDWRSGAEVFESMLNAVAPWRNLILALLKGGSVKKAAEIGANVGLEIATFDKSDKSLCDGERFEQSISALNKIAARFRMFGKGKGRNAEALRILATECDVIGSILGITLGTLHILRDYRRVRTLPGQQTLIAHFKNSCREYDGYIACLRGTMAEIEKTYAPCIYPWMLEIMTLIYRFAENFRSLSAKVLKESAKGSRAVLPIFDHRLDRFVNDRVNIETL